MPVVTIRALPQPPGVDPGVACRRVASAVAGCVGVPARRVFCTWQTVEAGWYAEGDVAATDQPEATHPPIVDVVLFEGRPPDVLESVLNTVAAVLTAELRLEPGNVFATITEARAGRVYTGGSVKR